MRYICGLLCGLLLSAMAGPALAATPLVGEPGILRPRDVAGMVATGGHGVQIAGGQGSFLYLVNGVPQPILGMGYNPRLSELSPALRADRLQRDFALMRRVGVNTIVGWDQAGFDDLFLDIAQANGLGVLMHFDLAREWDYADPELRARLLGQIAAWVELYREHPAVRMWGVGNEVMLVMTPEQSRAFADFYVQVYQTVRQHDTAHPIIYREAEDVRIPYFRDAFATAEIRPVDFVAGMNFYTPRIDEALDHFASYDFDVPILISEFAPAGVAPSSRAFAFRDMWQRVRRHERLVLGAAPYVWATDGPEAVDRIFGLTDPQGRPVDQTLAELQRLYRGRSYDPLPAPTPPPARGLDRTLTAAIAQALARGMAAPDRLEIDIPAIRREAEQRYRQDLAGAPGIGTVNRARVDRMVDLLVNTAVLAAMQTEHGPIYPGAVEALPLLAGMARWAAVDPRAEPVAEAFLAEVLAQALRD